MIERLRDRHILLIEDEYSLADELENGFATIGAMVLGPIASVDEAMNLIALESRIDGAVLDVNLGGDWIFPAADMLVERGVPFIFTTGYDAWMIPARFERVTRCEKPVNVGDVTQALGRAMAPQMPIA